MTETIIDPAQPQFAPITVIDRPFVNKIKSQDGTQSAIGIPIAAVPKGYKLKSLFKFFEEYRDRPARRSGTIVLRDWDSFIRFLDRYCSDSTTVAFQDGHKVTVVFDYHPPGPDLDQTGNGEFRAVYKNKLLGPIDTTEIRCPIFQGRAP